MTETQERFLKEVAAQIPVERVAEVHLFQSLRQGAVESGVAVLAVDRMVGGDAATGVALADDAPPPTDPGEARLAARRAAVSTRLTVYTAHYRLAIKGPDRGTWVMSVAAEADAPLVTVEAVVRGVRHRAGDGHNSERLSGDEFRAAVAAPVGTAWIAAK